MLFETLHVETRDGICTVTMSRPDKLNAMNFKMRRELGDCFGDIADDTAIRVVILTGAGKAFSAGGDINDFQNSQEDLHTLMGRTSHRWYRALWNLPQPVIAAVNGAAGGGGANLALGCDLVYASEEAYFAQTFLEIGLVPDLGGVFTLPRLVGPARAKEMALLGERVPAAEAERIGLVNAVFAPADLMAQVQRRAEHIAARSASAVTQTKRMINRSFETSMEGVLDQELAVQSFLFGTDASTSGVRRFLAARAKGALRANPGVE